MCIDKQEIRINDESMQNDEIVGCKIRQLHMHCFNMNLTIETIDSHIFPCSQEHGSIFYELD